MGRDNCGRPWPGVFVAFEGIDGSGKTTVARAVAERLASTFGRDVILTREPGGTPLGEGIRSLVLSESAAGIVPVAELLLFSAARAQHVSDVIEPQLRRGSILFCDRFTDSTIAYQWGGRGVPLQKIEAAQELATSGVSPDLRVLLDLPAAVALPRRHGETDSVNRFDAEEFEFHQSVREAYLSLARNAPEDWLVIDAGLSAEEVSEATYRSLISRITDLLACTGPDQYGGSRPKP